MAGKMECWVYYRMCIVSGVLDACRLVSAPQQPIELFRALRWDVPINLVKIRINRKWRLNIVLCAKIHVRRLKSCRMRVRQLEIAMGKKHRFTLPSLDPGQMDSFQQASSSPSENFEIWWTKKNGNITYRCNARSKLSDPDACPDYSGIPYMQNRTLRCIITIMVNF